MAHPEAGRRPEIHTVPETLREDVVLGRVCRVISSGGEIPQITQECTEVLRSFFGAASIGVWLADGDRLLLRGLALDVGAPEEAMEAVQRAYVDVPIDSDLPGAIAFRTRRPHYFTLESFEGDGAIGAIMEGVGADRLTAYPIGAEDEVVGVLLVGTSDRSPDPDEERLLLMALHHLATEILGRRRANRDREMAERLQNLQAAISKLPHPVKILSPDWRIRTINQAGLRLFGYEAGELVGQHIALLRSDGEGRATQREIELAVPQGGWHGEVMDQDRDGRLIPVSLTAVPIRDAAGRITSILEFEQDLTTEKQRAQQVREAYRLASIGELVASVAHEVNNPLGAIANYAQLLQLEPLPDEIASDVRAIYSEAMRAGAIIRNLLSFAREGVPEKRRVDLRQVMDSMVALRRHSLIVANIEMEVRIEAGVSLVMADAQQIQQVLHNLLTNSRQAIQKTGGGGRIRVIIRPGPIGFVELVVEDTGPGIPLELGERIFEAFFTTKPAEEGTGLGLSVSRAIMREHGGELEAGSWGRPRSQGGAAGEGGARFIARLPIAEVSDASGPEQQTPSPSGPSDPGSGRGRSVLIVDDEPVLAESVCRYFTRLGFEAEVALRAEVAVDRLSSGARFDVILSDLKMPGMGGEELYDRLTREWPEMVDSVIFTSGDVVSPETHRFLTKAGRPVIQKPYALEMLREMVEQAAAA